MSGDRRHPAMYHLVVDTGRGHRYESSGSGGPDAAQMQSQSLQEACVNLHYAAVEAGVIIWRPDGVRIRRDQMASWPNGYIDVDAIEGVKSEEP